MSASDPPVEVRRTSRRKSPRAEEPSFITDAVTRSSRRAKSICLITEEYVGITTGGGIGTCFAGLSYLLSQLGYQVDVLITGTVSHTDALQTARAQLDADGIGVTLLKEVEDNDLAPSVPLDSGDNIVKSYRCYRFLERQNYDVVHFHDYLGLGFYTAMAKRQGLLRSSVVTQTHGSSEWVRRHNLALPDLGALETEALERNQIELSDMLISPSNYMLDWYRADGIRLPEQTYVINWFLPSWSVSGEIDRQLKTTPLKPRPTEVIFFGRHERRKRFEVFIEALRQIDNPLQFDVTFLGRLDLIDRENSVSYALRQLRDFPRRLRFLNDYDHHRALRYIQSRSNALCVLPSLIENSPCTVGEAFSLSAPFITSDVGGTRELVDPAHRKIALVPAEPRALARRLADIYEAGLPRITSTLSPAHIARAWEQLHESLDPVRLKPHSASNRAGRSGRDTPLVSVCLVHHERPKLLVRALEHLFEQTYPNIEIIVVDDGSESAAATAMLDELEADHGHSNFRIIRSSNQYLGAARNLAANMARGDYLMFHDDDNVAEPREIEIFMQAARTGKFEVLTAQYYVFKDNDRPETGKIEYFPIGVGGTHSFFSNRFGDANALVTRSAFDTVGGFTERYSVGWEDWEFFLKAYLKGIRIGIVPRPLFRYHCSSAGMLASGSPSRNNARIFDAVRDAKPMLTADLLEMVRRDAIAQQVLDKTWDTLGSEPFGFLHRELMALQPNSDEARTKMVDLAFHLRRFDDALELGLGSPSTRDQLYSLFAASSSFGWRESRLVPEPCTVLSDKNRAYEIEGWLATGELVPLRICNVLIGQQCFSVETYEAALRQDVAASQGQNGMPLVGFKLYIAENPGFIRQEDTTEIGLDRVGYDFPSLDGPIRLTVRGRHDVRVVSGWIERLTPVCRKLVRLPIAGRAGFTGRLEFLLHPQPEDGRIVWRTEASPLICVGEKRFEAFSAGLNSLPEVAGNPDVPVLSLYSRNDLSIMEAVAYRWN